MWACQVCTLDNEELTYYCAVCGSKREVSIDVDLDSPDEDEFDKQTPMEDQKKLLKRQVKARSVLMPVVEVANVLQDVQATIGSPETEEYAMDCLPGLIKMAVDNDLLFAACWSNQVHT